jgi:hypothetical protein
MKIASIGRIVCTAAIFAVMGLSSGQAGSPASYMYILMVNMIGPSANSLWKTAGTPALNDQDWDQARQMAVRLAESANGVSAGGTTTEDIERARSGEWKTWASKFRDAVSLAASAAERRDQAALVAAADDLMEVCKGCHMAFPQAAQ